MNPILKTILIFPMIVLCMISCKETATIGGCVVLQNETPIANLEIGLFMKQSMSQKFQIWDEITPVASTLTDSSGNFKFIIDQDENIKLYVYFPTPVIDKNSVNAKYSPYSLNQDYSASWGTNKKIVLKPAVDVQFTVENIQPNDSIIVRSMTHIFSRQIIQLPVEFIFSLIPGEINKIHVQRYRNGATTFEDTIDVKIDHINYEKRKEYVFVENPVILMPLYIP